MDTTSQPRSLLRPQVFVWFVMAAIAALLIGLYVRSRAPTGYDITVAGAPYGIPDAKGAVHIVAAPIVNHSYDSKGVYRPSRSAQRSCR